LFRFVPTEIPLFLLHWRYRTLSDSTIWNMYFNALALNIEGVTCDLHGTTFALSNVQLTNKKWRKLQR
jgi:hypothetical protein